MHFSVGFVLAALALSASSSPVNTKKGTKIALSKRSGAITAEGVANPAWYRSHLAGIHAKYERGFRNFERNTGEAHPLAFKKTGKRSTGNNALTDANSQLWYGEIEVGSPANKFTVDYDTGSSDLFVPGPDCGNCDGHSIFDPSQSSTSSNIRKTFTLTYGDGSSVSGEQYTDTVTISGLTATKQTLGVANTYSSGFTSDSFPADGLMGMGYKSLSDYGANPVFQTLKAQGKTDAGVFAFKLSSSGSSLFLGGTDSSDFTGQFTYVPVTKQGYWQVNLDGITVNGKSAIKKASSIIDTGTTFIVGDSSSVQKVVAAISGAQAAPVDIYGPGTYMARCSSIPTLTLTFGGKAWSVSPDTLNMGTIEGDSSNCLLGLADDPQNAGFWIVGDVFLQNVYTVFDLDSNRVGFAKLA